MTTNPNRFDSTPESLKPQESISRSRYQTSKRSCFGGPWLRANSNLSSNCKCEHSRRACRINRLFYPAVQSEEYAIKIARDWNVPAAGRGFVTRFRVRKEFFGQL